jgi:hypothetical protein
MERAAGAPLRTREIAATDNPRWSDSTLRLTRLGSRFDEAEADAVACIRGLRDTLAVCHKKTITAENNPMSLDTTFAKRAIFPIKQTIA